MITKDEIILQNILDDLEKMLSENEFEYAMKKAIEIDSNYYNKKLERRDIINIIKEYRKKKINVNNFKYIQVLLVGNPEIVLRMAIESARNNVSMIITIDDFCLAQNTLIINTLNIIFERNNLNIKLTLENLLTIDKIIKNSSKTDVTFCIGDSNKYNLLEGKIKDLRFYPYGIFEIYADSDEFDELKEKIFDIVSLNRYEIEIYDSSMSIEEIIEILNTEGYNFCSLLLSKDKKKQEKLKNEIASEYVVINENPFNKIKFKFEL